MLGQLWFAFCRAINVYISCLISSIVHNQLTGLVPVLREPLEQLFDLLHVSLQKTVGAALAMDLRLFHGVFCLVVGRPKFAKTVADRDGALAEVASLFIDVGLYLNTTTTVVVPAHRLLPTTFLFHRPLAIRNRKMTFARPISRVLTRSVLGA